MRKRDKFKKIVTAPVRVPYNKIKNHRRKRKIKIKITTDDEELFNKIVNDINDYNESKSVKEAPVEDPVDKEG